MSEKLTEYNSEIKDKDKKIEELIEQNKILQIDVKVLKNMIEEIMNET